MRVLIISMLICISSSVFAQRVSDTPQFKKDSINTALVNKAGVYLQKSKRSDITAILLAIGGSLLLIDAVNQDHKHPPLAYVLGGASLIFTIRGSFLKGTAGAQLAKVKY